MKILLDTIDLEIIKRFCDVGLLFGVTTNPTLAKRFGMSDDIDMIKKIRNVMASGEIHVEAFGKCAEEIVKNAKRIQYKTKDKNLVFKVPFNVEGVKAVSTLKHSLGFKTNLHLIFSVNQALLSSCVQSDYICPLVGRLDDVGHEAFENLRKIVDSFSKSKSNTTKVMVSSVRHPQHVQSAFMLGADVITVPPSVLEKMFSHPLTNSGYVAFEEDIKMMQSLQHKDIDTECVVESYLPLKKCLEYMTESKKTAIVTSYEGKNGIYTLGDFKRFLVKNSFNLSNYLDKPISDFVNFETIELDSRATYGDVSKIFKKFEISHVLITEKKKLLGVLTRKKINA